MGEGEEVEGCVERDRKVRRRGRSLVILVLPEEGRKSHLCKIIHCYDMRNYWRAINVTAGDI